MKLKLNTYEPHPAGMHRAVITSVVEDEVDYKKGNGPEPVVKFGLVTDDGTLTVTCTPTYSDRSKLGKLAAAVFGERPEEIDTDSLRGKELVVVVEHEKNGDAIYDRVTAFAPYKAGAKVDPFEKE